MAKDYNVFALFYLLECLLDQIKVAVELGHKDNQFDKYHTAINRVHNLFAALYTVTTEIDYENETPYECFNRMSDVRSNWFNLFTSPEDQTDACLSLVEHMLDRGEIAMTVAWILHGEHIPKW